MSWSDWKTVLVVDDDEDVLAALQKRLGQVGLDVLTAKTGEAALHLARNTTVDAMTLDVSLPGDLDGLAVAGALQKDPRTAKIPVIFVTGTADADFKRKCDQVGGRYFLAKPYDGDLLITLLKGIFGEDELAEMKRISQAKRRQPVSG